MRKFALLAALLAACTAIAAPAGRSLATRNRAPRPVPATRFVHPTNCAVVCGVTMPPKYREEMWLKREELRRRWVEKMNAALDEIDRMAKDVYESSLSAAQRNALAQYEADRLAEAEKVQAERQRRKWELEAITNRVQWVKREWKDRRRTEIEYHPGLKWLDSDIVKEEVQTSESGRVKVHFLYTADGKKHRYDPDAIADQLLKEAERNALNTILKEGK